MLRTLCQDYEKAVKMIGAPAADVLRTRLADLRAATYLAELPAGRPTVFDGEPPRLEFELRSGWSLVVSVAHQSVPRTTQGELDVTKVRRVLVQEIIR
ncbi:MAG: hypothetical protein LC749_03285 [Actinobacteria bacterium]|nr:hypothetical protein [Actinomycetota bacterium]